jgi:hypothetical protein
MRSPTRLPGLAGAVSSLLMAACGLSLLAATGCGGESRPLVPPHLDLPIAPAPTATHAGSGADAPKSTTP